MADKKTNVDNKEISRRQFLKAMGGAAVGVGLGGVLPQLIHLGDGVYAVPASGGYLLVDSGKCGACTSCMAACSLAHEGSVNLSLSRFQVMRNPLEFFPNDISLEQCRQCVHPACVEACPTGAMHVDANYNNVRTVDEAKCVGCQQCVEACPQQPARVQWNHEKKHAQKCDLCSNAPYWEGEGPACVMACPMGAIKYTKEIPTQFGEAGYKVDLKPSTWGPDTWYAPVAQKK